MTSLHSATSCRLLTRFTAFTDLLKLVNIVLTLPVTTTSNERLFSTLDRVKNSQKFLWRWSTQWLVSSFLS